MKFSEKLRIARKERGLTQPELARHLAVRASDVSDWENERSEPLESKYARLAMVLGVPEAYLTNDKYDYVDDVPEDMRGARTQPKTHVKDTLYAPRSDAPAGRKSSGNVDNLRKPGASETVQHSAGPRRVVTTTTTRRILREVSDDEATSASAPVEENVVSKPVEEPKIVYVEREVVRPEPKKEAVNAASHYEETTTTTTTTTTNNSHVQAQQQTAVTSPKVETAQVATRKPTRVLGVIATIFLLIGIGTFTFWMLNIYGINPLPEVFFVYEKVQWELIGYAIGLIGMIMAFCTKRRGKRSFFIPFSAILGVIYLLIIVVMAVFAVLAYLPALEAFREQDNFFADLILRVRLDFARYETWKWLVG